VQRVQFRVWTTQEARALGLAGWVRNHADGSVEAVFCGPSNAVDAMLAKCNHGPPAALVTDVSVEPADAPPDAGFILRPDV